MLQNAYLLAKIGADTAENERKFSENLPKIGNDPPGPAAQPVPHRAPIPVESWSQRPPSRHKEPPKVTCLLQIFGGLDLGCIKSKFCKTMYV